MDNRPVGIFDSGFGGLTAFTALRKLMPEENIIFFADSARAPYGPRSAQEIQSMTKQDLEFVASLGVKAILAACGTVSVNAPELIRDFPVPTLGVLEDSVAYAAALPCSGPIGVIATAASVESGMYEKRLSELCPGREIISVACPDYVTLIESGRFCESDEGIRAASEKYLRVMKEKKAEVLLLGCTHFGLISKAIRAYLGEDIRLVSASECAVRAMAELLTARDMTGSGGKTACYTSGSAEDFDERASRMLSRSIEGTVHVPVMEVPGTT